MGLGAWGELGHSGPTSWKRSELELGFEGQVSSSLISEWRCIAAGRTQPSQPVSVLVGERPSEPPSSRNSFAVSFS